MKKFDRFIRNKIIPPESLMRNKHIVHLSPEVNSFTNCYAYALGILFDSKIKFNPGTLCGTYCNPSDVVILQKNIEGDLKHLRIKYRIINLDKHPVLKANEYLVKVYISYTPHELSKYGDYHFVRQDTRSSIWFHKWGYSSPCVILDEDRNPYEPNIIIQQRTDGKIFEYYPLFYIAIKY